MLSARNAGLVLLAAGASRRMGSPKQLVEIDGQAMLARATAVVLASCCRPAVIVCGASFTDIVGKLAGLPVEIVRNRRWEDGIGTSIHAGIEALSAHGVGAAVIALGDQPLIHAADYDGLVDAWQSGGSFIVASRYAGTLGVPALFDSSLFAELLALAPDEGCKRLIASCPAGFLAIRDCPEAQIDLDTPDDVTRLRQRIASGVR